MDFLRVHAQEVDNDVDTLAAPTFPFTPPLEDPDPLAATGEIILDSEKAVFEIGEAFTLTVRIESGELELTEYNIVISYDPTLLQITDEDSTTSGIQVNYTDTFFTEDVNLASTQLGTIQISGSTPTSGVTVNRNVAQIEFTTLKAGTDTLEVVENQSSLADGKTDLLGTTIPLVITVTGEAEEPGDVIIPPVIPKSGIFDGMPLISGILGFLLVAIGIILGIKYRKPDNENNN